MASAVISELLIVPVAARYSDVPSVELRNKYIDNGTKQLANFSKEVILDKINTLWKA